MVLWEGMDALLIKIHVYKYSSPPKPIDWISIQSVRTVHNFVLLQQAFLYKTVLFKLARSGKSFGDE